jgi:hypothetical protein
MSDRQEANRAIVMYLFNMIENEPDLRFGQILQALKIVNKLEYITEDGEFVESSLEDEFYLESSELLKRVESSAKKEYL